MGAFFIAPARGSDAACQALDRQHRDRGFALAKHVALDDVSLYLYRNLQGTGGSFIETADGGFACLVGELLYRGATGTAALQHLVADMAGPGVDPQRLIGQYAVLVKDAQGLRIMTDPLAFYQVYVNAAAGLASSSFWAMLELSERLSADTEGLYEYAWTGATYGGKTFVREIRRLPAGAQMVFAGGAAVTPASPYRAAASLGADASLGDYVEEHAGRLRGLFQDLADAYGERLKVSFSSGYDSRLILAGLKAAGLRPGLFVYGQDGDTDVRIARQLAAGEGLALRVIDKDRMVDPVLAASPERQEADFVRFDASKVDGIFDDGVDTPDRLSRHADGGVPLNGSLGEIYRNFFYIPDHPPGRPPGHPMALADVAESFFSSYAPAACTDQFTAENYIGGLVRAFQTDLGTSDTRVSRAQVEALYPLARGRYWTGRDVTLNLRFGPMHFPFMNKLLIDGTPEIPIAFKTHGRLEAKLIERLDPALAAYPSGYGYRFSDPPPLKHRARSWLTLFRPPWLRRYSYRVRFARPQPLPDCVSPPRLAGLMDATLPCMRPYFHPERIYDPGVLNRVATMEYIFQKYAVRP